VSKTGEREKEKKKKKFFFVIRKKKKKKKNSLSSSPESRRHFGNAPKRNTFTRTDGESERERQEKSQSFKHTSFLSLPVRVSG
jgi:hypothetical protein